MEAISSLIPQKLLVILEKARITTPKQILLISKWELAKITNLNDADINIIRSAAANSCCPQIYSGKDLLKTSQLKIPTGIQSIDNILLGGFRSGVITEIFGESGSGKSQICLQSAVNNCQQGAIYICTEDAFPIKRFNQMKEYLTDNDAKLKCGNNIFVEHITEPEDLLSCIRVRLPKLLSKYSASLIIIDSVAAPFRCETANYIQRADDIRDLALCLLKLSQQHNSAVVCVNQVTSALEEDEIVPALGLAWSNMITNRICIKKTTKTHLVVHAEEASLAVREFSVVFSPELPLKSADFAITSRGIESLG